MRRRNKETKKQKWNQSKKFKLGAKLLGGKYIMEQTQFENRKPKGLTSGPQRHLARVTHHLT
jgi:hypothetical protein